MPESLPNRASVRFETRFKLGDLLPQISVVQPADAWHSDDNALVCLLGLNGSTRRRLLVEPIVSSVFGIVMEVISTEPAQMGFVENDHVVQQISSAACHPSLRDPILPGALLGGADGLHAHRSDGCDHALRELGIPIQDQIAVPTLVGKGFAQLPHDPRCSGMFGHVEVQDSSPAMTDHEEAVQNAEGHGWHREEIDGRDHLPMVLEEAQPLPASRRGPTRARYRETVRSEMTKPNFKSSP
jgi:hypothetical protein